MATSRQASAPGTNTNGNDAGALDLHCARGYAEPTSGECVMKFRPLAICLAGIVLALTLPQSILLWTEPDMEAEG